MRKYLLIFLLFPSLSVSQTSIWKVSKSGYELYLGGTLHLLKKEDYPLPTEFDQAFKLADKLVLETNVDEASSPAFGKRLTELMTYPSGKTLKDDISAATFKRLQLHLAARQVAVDDLLHYKPAMIMLVLSMIELKRIGMVDAGVDEHYQRKAMSIGKPIGYFETVEDQLMFLSKLGEGEEDELIEGTIKDIERLDSMLDAMKTAWVQGDAKRLAKEGMQQMIDEYPEVYQSILVDRNNNWIPSIERMLRDKPIEIVLVGALHLVGKDGLLQQLRNKGYRVEHF